MSSFTLLLCSALALPAAALTSSTPSACAPSRPAPLRQLRRAAAPAAARAASVRMQNGMGDTGAKDAEMGNMFWAAWSEEHGVTDTGEFPAGEDAVEDELKRLFSIDLDDDFNSSSSSEIDDVKVPPRMKRGSRAPIPRGMARARGAIALARAVC
eukprot:1661252-Prymnesium_polylepis.1